MAALTSATIIGAVGLAASVAGTATAVVGQQKAAGASRRAEKLRSQQMSLEASRKRREQIRQMLISQGLISNNAANAGVGQQSSGVISGSQAVASNTAFNATGVDQSESIGAGIFDANADIASAGATTSLGQGISSFGSNLTANSKAGGRVVDSLFSLA